MYRIPEGKPYFYVRKGMLYFLLIPRPGPLAVSFSCVLDLFVHPSHFSNIFVCFLVLYIYSAPLKFIYSYYCALHHYRMFSYCIIFYGNFLKLSGNENDRILIQQSAEIKTYLHVIGKYCNMRETDKIRQVK